MTLVDTATAAVAAGVRPATIHWWVHKGYLPAQTTPRGNRYQLADVFAAVDRPSRPKDHEC